MDLEEVEQEERERTLPVAVSLEPLLSLSRLPRAIRFRFVFWFADFLSGGG